MRRHQHRHRRRRRRRHRRHRRHRRKLVFFALQLEIQSLGWKRGVKKLDSARQVKNFEKQNKGPAAFGGW